MSKRTCHELDELWDRYLSGECTKEEEQQVEQHLEQCAECRERLDQAMDAQEPLLPPAPESSTLPTDRQQRRWMQRAKWRNRLSSALNLLAIFIVLSILSGISTSVYYAVGGSSSVVHRLPDVLSTAVGMTMPNLNVGSGGVQSGVYFNLSMDYEMTKRVGHRSQSQGTLKADMRFHLLSVKRQWTKGSYQSELYFKFPGTPGVLDEEQRRYVKETDDQVWKALEMLPEGTVSELAISLDDLYSLDEVYAMFGKYDMDIIWYAFDTGQEERIGNLGSYLHGGSGGLWGISDQLLLKYAEGNGFAVLGDAPVKERAFLRALETLQADERWVRKVVTVDPMLQERIDYVREHGVRSYGIVVTGPTKELLKLREQPHVTRPALGETDWWNWYMPEFSSVQY